MKISIIPPFWMTWYFYLLMGLVFIGILFLYKKYTLISVSQKNEIKLEKLEHALDLVVMEDHMTGSYDKHIGCKGQRCSK